MTDLKKEIQTILNKAESLEDIRVALNLMVDNLNREIDSKLCHIEFQKFQVYYRNVNDKYRQYEIPKKSGGIRVISAPDEYLIYIQRLIKEILELFFQATHFSHGFIKDRSIVSNAEMHLNKNYVLNIDLADFFPSINFHRVKNILLAEPFAFNEKASEMLSRICVLKGKLPQGAPTSPIISNLACIDLDRKLSAFSLRFKLTYTRYADDITFSGYRRIFDNTFFKELDQIIKKEGFKRKISKTRIQGRNKRQEVTGITVNEKLNVNRKYIRELRSMIHHYKLGKGHDNAFAVISGKLEFLKMVKGKDRVYKNLLNRFK
jgi:RNA-directed DNA polymerase